MARLPRRSSSRAPGIPDRARRRLALGGFGVGVVAALGLGAIAAAATYFRLPGR